MIYNFNMYTNIQTLFSIFCESQKIKKKKNLDILRKIKRISDKIK